jgi:hypothetical protein
MEKDENTNREEVKEENNKEVINIFKLTFANYI